MKKERGRKTMQGTTITQGKAHSGSWLPNRIPYKYLRMQIMSKYKLKQLTPSLV